ncbi:MAG: hypothetical protein ABI346_00855 [Candidatus Baltobacteraceae bacterium]
MRGDTITTRAALAGAAILALHGCAPQSNAGLAPSPPRTQTATKGWLSPGATRGQHLIYVSSAAGGTGEVNIYTRSSTAPIRTILSGVSSPQGLAVDAGGDLYVANSGNNTVTVYPPGKLMPSVTYASGVSQPDGVGVGADGYVYVANVSGGPSGDGSVTEYPPGSTIPSLTLTLPGLSAVNVALDGANDLYVSWFAKATSTIQVEKYAPGSSSGTNLRLDLPPGSFPAYAIAFDHAGNLVLPYENLSHGAPKYIGVFPPGSTEPSLRIRDGSLLDVVAGIAFPRDSRLFYVASEGDQIWMRLTYPIVEIRSITSVGIPRGLALSPGT